MTRLGIVQLWTYLRQVLSRGTLWIPRSQNSKRNRLDNAWKRLPAWRTTQALARPSLTTDDPMKSRSMKLSRCGDLRVLPLP
jgi:hypothetical protein